MACLTLGLAACRGDDPPEPSKPAVVEASATVAPTARPVATKVAIPWLPPEVMRHRSTLEGAAAQHGVDADLIAIVTLVESGGWVQAKSGSGARGLMQLMPSTARIIAEERGLTSPTTSELLAPATNVDYGTFYLGQQLRAFASDEPAETVRRAAGAYNGGPTAFRRFLEGTFTLSAQTVRYRRWVGGMWDERHRSRSATFRAWRAAGGDRLLARAQAEAEAKAP